MIRGKVRALLSALEAYARPVRHAQRHELAYWWGRKQREGTLTNDHYVWAFTTFFGLPLTWYAGKRLLDVGCGPRGSLEWATMAAERVGVDPLADSYRRLGTAAHQMRYVRAPAERLPFADGSFDVVSSFNSLDHGRDPEAAAAELQRVCRPGGLILLLVEVNHVPTPTEPLTLPWEVPAWFVGRCAIRSLRHFEVGPVHDLYATLRRDDRFNAADRTNRPAWLAMKAERLDAPFAPWNLAAREGF